MRTKVLAEIVSKSNCLSGAASLGAALSAFVLVSASTLVLSQAALGDSLKSSSRWQKSTASSSNDYGAVSSHIKRLEDNLSLGQKDLSSTEFYDLQSRIYSLKQGALLDLSKGGDASEYVQPAQSLEAELARRVKESAQHFVPKATQAGYLLTQLESSFAKRKDELIEEDAKRFQTALSELNNRIARSASSDETMEHLMHEIRELENKMTDRFIFGPKRYSLRATKTEEPLSETRTLPGGSGANPSEAADPAANAPANAAPVAAALTNLTTVLTPAPGQSLKKNAKPYKPISKLIEEIENSLMNFHDKKQIGSFDMDAFTERLLAQKRNLKVMMSRTGRVSLRQEHALRAELEKLQDELHDRVLGND